MENITGVLTEHFNCTRKQFEKKLSKHKGKVFMFLPGNSDFAVRVIKEHLKKSLQNVDPNDSIITGMVIDKIFLYVTEIKVLPL